MLAVLTVIAVVAAGLLAWVNAITAPQIEKINADNLAAGIKSVMGGGDIQVSEPWETDGFTGYEITDAEGAALGKAIVAEENGFGGKLKVLVGFNMKGDILGYTVLEHAETPGLGAKAGEWFQDKIIGMNPGSSNFTVSKDGGEVDAITASTITSRAFLRAVRNAYEKVFSNKDASTGATGQAAVVNRQSEMLSRTDASTGATEQASDAKKSKSEAGRAKKQRRERPAGHRSREKNGPKYKLEVIE